MCKLFYPDFEAKSAYEVDYETLYKEGYRGVIFDVDNTLVPHGAPADERAVFLFKRLKEIGCYRGSRHIKGLPVRGQTSKNNARTRKGPKKTVANKKK